jgi:hypothetical protein
MPLRYEAIFHGQTSTTQSLADRAIWFANLPLDETEEEPDKIAKFTAACVRLVSATNQVDLLIPDGLNRHHFEALEKDSNTAQVLAVESGAQWREKKQKDIEIVKNLKSIFSWDNLFEDVVKQGLLKFLEQYYEKVSEFRVRVDNAVGHRVAYITERALSKKLISPVAPGAVLFKIFKACVLEECAGILAIRLKGYEHAFYLAKLNLAASFIATAIFPLETEEINNDLLSKINKTVLTFHTPSQYKQINNVRQQATIVQTPEPKAQTNRQYLSSMVEEYRWPHVDPYIALRAFFDSPTIPTQVKIDVLFTIISKNQDNNPKAMTTSVPVNTTAPIISGELGFSMTPTASTHTQSINHNQNNTDINSNNNMSPLNLN